ncbi:MAG TPA: response regulator [Thermoanaerobaculia bacterium]|nr:response regulator [Thermoanaerobaculia bacterium]
MDNLKPILVVDDDAPTQLLLKALLARYGYTVELASDGGGAIALLRESDYSAIVLDLMMPVIGGEGVIAYLRETGRRIPVIVCTAAGTASTATLDADVVKAVLRKPFDIEQFVGTVSGLAGVIAPVARVLIVDDDLRARYVMRAFLEPAEVTEAESGDEAFRLLRESRPDLVLLDLILPDAPGEEVLQKIRETVETSALPVIIVTSRKLDDPERARLLTRAAAVVYKGDLSRETMRQALQAIKPRK